MSLFWCKIKSEILEQFWKIHTSHEWPLISQSTAIKTTDFRYAFSQLSYLILKIAL